MGALNWSEEITKHNQRLFNKWRAENASNAKKGKAANDDNQPFPLVPASELTLRPIQVIWLLENIIEQGSLNLLFGEPGAGKSLFALEWAFCIAAGISWNSYRTKQSDVVIVAGEGFAGMARRLKALEQKYKIKSPDRLFISKRPADFIDTKNIQWLADTIKNTCPNPGLVIIDTLHRNMNGDENSSQDIGQFINNIDLYLKPLGAAALPVHHSGHGQKDRSRGSSSIRAAMDAEFSATKSNGSITLTCHKAKDFEAFKPLQFALKPITLDWMNDDGEPLTSVYLEHSGEATQSTKKHKWTERESAILTSLVEVIAGHGIEPTAEIKASFPEFNGLNGKDIRVVNIQLWREKSFQVIKVNSGSDEQKQDSLIKAFNRCREKFITEKLTIEFSGYVWRRYD